MCSTKAKAMVASETGKQHSDSSNLAWALVLISGIIAFIVVKMNLINRCRFC